MKAKKQFQELVSRLRDALPKDKAFLADEVHRAAGEARREFTSLSQKVKEATNQNEQQKHRLNTLSKERDKAASDATALSNENDRLKRAFAKEKQSYVDRSLPYHDSVIDALLELFRAVGLRNSPLTVIRNMVKARSLNLDADFTTLYEELSQDDHIRLLKVATDAARYTHCEYMCRKCNQLQHVNSRSAVDASNAFYDEACEFLVEAYLDGECLIPLPPPIVGIAASVLRSY